MRFSVIGSPGAGKSTFARRLAAAHGLPHVELDVLHWGPGWTEVSDVVMRARVAEAVAAPAWVVDGNYPQVRDLVWARADQVVWLDLPLWRVLPRLLRRSAARVVSGHPLWHDNRETFARAFLSAESVTWWALKTFRKRRAAYERLLADPASPPNARLRTPAEVERWLEVRGAPASEGVR